MRHLDIPAQYEYIERQANLLWRLVVVAFFVGVMVLIGLSILTYIGGFDDTPQGYLLIDLSDNQVLVTSPCPDGMVGRWPDAIWYHVTVDGVEYPEGDLYLPPGQRLIRVRTEGWKPPSLCGPAYEGG